MNWEAMAAEEKKVFDLLAQARAVAEEDGGRLLAASALLDIMTTAFRYDRCKELSELALVYSQRKMKEEEEQL